MLFHPLFVSLALILLKIVCLLVAIAYFTLAERKVMAAIQRRRGPNVVGLWGLLQPAADGLKLIAKEMIVPSHANSRIFVAAPLVVLSLSLLSWGVVPFGLVDASEKMSTAKVAYTIAAATPPHTFEHFQSSFELSDLADVRYGIFVMLAFSSLSVYGIIISGWSSNSKYAFLGALRSAAQMISYEVTISLTILPVVLLAGSLNLVDIVHAQIATVWFVGPLLPLSIVFFIAMIAETNRTPFDLPEAEAELVAGYNVEYSSIIFAMFFLAEYGNMILIALLSTIFYWGGWDSPACLGLSSAFALSLKTLFFCFLFILVRATFPRYRYDQLMDIGWRYFLPVTTGFFIYITGALIVIGALPIVNEINLEDCV